MGMASLSPCLDFERELEAAPMQDVMVAAATSVAQKPIDPRPTFGPPQPSDEEIALEYAQSFGYQRWVHPLPGPQRRMPIRMSRAFGANRPGHRPHECRSGHCGVDIGGEVWGEHVLASHDGVIEKVNRNVHRSGGKYVRIAHLDGTVFTQYFHLAAIPPHLYPGRRIRAGQVVGLLGETGVKNSGPHLHFTVSVMPTEESTEVFIDPEPLIALWPVREGPTVASKAAARQPGVPIGVAGRYKRSRRKARALATGGPQQAVQAAEAPIGLFAD
jgi:murein DD-endopeptidase MepM/ murein hydrolase activator NlpD